MKSTHYEAESQPRPVDRPIETSCCVVGGGPAGVIAALLLARQGVRVVLLEMHRTFDREFRGDTIHPSTMEILDQVGLADRLLEFPHAKARSLSAVTAEGRYVFAEFSRLKTRFPYITMMPQARLLDFLVDECRKLPGFQVIMNANVQDLIEEGGVVRGVRYTGPDGEKRELRAALTIGADGRFSRVRRLAGFEPVKQAPADHGCALDAAAARCVLAGRRQRGAVLRQRRVRRAIRARRLLAGRVRDPKGWV